LLREEAAGDPMTRQKWVRLSLARLQELLAQRGYTLDTHTIRRLLLKLGFSLKANRKRFTGPPHPDRDRQFRYIARLKKHFFRAGWPVISVDTKKKELIGNFKNAGRTWCEQGEEVNAHDFPQDALARASPYGIYLPQLDRGYVYVGLSRDTPEFAVDAISHWWQNHGRLLFPRAKRLLILADAGGSNGCRPRLWKRRLQQMADREGLTITVCHYPRGASKWNPVEHRLFSFISINWAGKPLRTLATMLGYIRDTETETGLRVEAVLLPGPYKTGVKVSKQEWQAIRLHRHKTCPSWNYTISPHRRKHS
jgi:Rhodopirellula transposase DDE domain